LTYRVPAAVLPDGPRFSRFDSDGLYFLYPKFIETDVRVIAATNRIPEASCWQISYGVSSSLWQAPFLS